MSEVTIINQESPAKAQEQTLQGLLVRGITFLVILLVIGLVVALGFGLFLLIDNFDYIQAFFTTGLIGYLNPFDSPDDDFRLDLFQPFRFIPIVGPFLSRFGSQ